MANYRSAYDFKIQSKGFQNWMKCVSAHNETRKALCEVVEVKWKGYISQLTDAEKDHIETFLECLKNSKIGNFITSQAVLECQHSPCTSLRQKLLHLCNTELRTNENEIYTIPSSDLCYRHYWSIAKLYCAEGEGVTKAGLIGLDISTMLRMLDSCQLFTFDGSKEIYENICEDRDELFHSIDNTISYKKRSIVLENASKLLSKFCGPRLKVCEDAIVDIQQIEAKDWHLEYQYEYKQIARQNLERKIDAIILDMSLRDDDTLQDLLASSENLLQMVNERISDELQEEREVKKDKEEIKSERKALMEEIERLKERNSYLEIEKCRARLHAVLSYTYFSERSIIPQPSVSSKIQVNCFGTCQDTLIQIDELSILFDPFGTDLAENGDHHPLYYKEHIALRHDQHKLSLDAVVLSTCLYSFTSTTIKGIVENSPNVKWLITTDRKNWLISLGVIETSILQFDMWEAKEIYFGRTKTTFACTKTSINSTSLQKEKCNSCGWVIKGSERTFYYSGITNYHEKYFKKVAEEYGPIHLALLPLDISWNMSCLAKFKVTLSEVINMHVDVGSQQSLCFSHCWNNNDQEKEERELKQTMENLQLDPSTFVFLRPGYKYESN